MPLWVLGVIEVALLTGALRGSRLPRFGREVMVGSLVLLVLPFLALPVGSLGRALRRAHVRQPLDDALLPLGVDLAHGVASSPC